MKFFIQLVFGVLAVGLAAPPVQATLKPRIAGPRPLRCAGAAYGPSGSYYRKVESLADPGLAGLRAEGRLPTARFNAARTLSLAGDAEARQAGPLDRPSVYLGARSKAAEVDAGLSWDRVYDGGRGDAGARFAFRPFWRVSGRSGGQWSNPPPGSRHDVYFSPGEAILMEIRWLGQDRLRLRIVSRADPGRSFEQDFSAPGFGDREGREAGFSFKRVNAIDQYRVDSGGDRRGNEGRPAIATTAAATDAAWDSVFLLDPAGEPAAALSGDKCVEVFPKGKAAGACSITPLSEGGERIDIVPGPSRSGAQ